MTWLFIILLTVYLFSKTNLGTCIRYSFHYACKSYKLEGIHIINVDGNNIRYIMIIGALTLLPDNVLELMKKKNVVIFYSKDTEQFSTEDYSGLFSRQENFIFIWDSGLIGNWDWQVTTILHEVGHFVDYSVGYHNFLSCADKNLHNIYDGEHKYYKRYSNGKYFTNNICEYFAQGFAEYFLVERFKKECPDTSSYIECVLESV